MRARSLLCGQSSVVSTAAHAPTFCACDCRRALPPCFAAVLASVLASVLRPSNILEWHFVIKGPKDTPYVGGSYHGKLIFPSEYPYKPPAIMMLTPNGRFNTNTRLCLSMSDFHPETWVPAWSVASILNGVLSFMLESTPTVRPAPAPIPQPKRETHPSRQARSPQRHQHR